MPNYLPQSKIFKQKKSLFTKALVLVALVAGVSISAINPISTQAQEAQSATTIVAIPPKRGDNEEILRVSPGEKFQTSIRVRNTSDKALTLESFVKDFIVAEDGFTPIAVNEDVSNRWSLAEWMTIAPNTHKLGPGEIAQLQVLIEVPKDALAGGRYAMVLHRPANGGGEFAIDGSADHNSASAISQQVGTLFYVIVDGPINESAFVRLLNFKKFSEFGPVPYSYMVENQSDVHIKAQTRIDIHNILGIKVGTIVPDVRNVFPLMSREFEGEWDRKWGFGLYTARLTMSYGDLGQVALASAKFWIVPIRLIILILIITIVIATVIVMRKKKKQEQDLLAQKHIEELEKKIEYLEHSEQKE